MEIFTALVNKIPEILTKIRTGLSSIWTGITSAVSNWVTGFTDIGKNILEGLWEGLKNTKDWLVEKIGDLCGTITDSVKEVFGIHSPSDLFADEVGVFLALGIGEGFSKSMGKVTKDMTNALPTSLDASPTINNSVDKISKNITMLDFTSVFKTPRALSALNNPVNNPVTANNGVVLNLTIENFSNNSNQDVESLAKLLTDEIAKSQKVTNLEINRRLNVW